jgi:hypothetical protein
MYVLAHTHTHAIHKHMCVHVCALNILPNNLYNVESLLTCVGKHMLVF